MTRYVKYPTWATSKGYIEHGAQLHLDHIAEVGMVAQVTWSCHMSTRADNHCVVRIREDLRGCGPHWEDKTLTPWEWEFPEPCLYLSSGDLVMVVSEATVTHEVPNYPEPWDIRLCLVHKLDAAYKFGWVKKWDLQVPFLLPQ